MLKKDIKVINEVFIDERECGHTMCDFDDHQNDLEVMAETIGVDMIENEDEEWVFKSEKDRLRVEEALNYYYNLHGC